MSKIDLTIPEINHIIFLLEENEKDEWYFAPANQYWARHNRIKKKLCEMKNIDFIEFIPTFN